MTSKPMTFLVLPLAMASCSLRPACVPHAVGSSWPASSDSASPCNPVPAEQLNDIYEAVFRHLFEDNESALRKKASVYFLEVQGGVDPDDELLRRFGAQTPPVRPASEACFAEATSQVRSSTTSKDGLLFYVSSACLSGIDEAEVSAGYYEANLSSSGHLYIMKNVRGVWTVVSYSQHWIS